MKERIVLITGSTDGVGKCVAERLGRPGTKVLIHGRDAARAESVASVIRANGGNASTYLADFSSLKEVDCLAEKIRHDHDRIDVLINNAGIGVGRDRNKREVSIDGLELRFAVNYLSGFLLTRRLLPIMSVNGSRIVNVSSVGQQSINFDDVMLEYNYSGGRAYCQSKLAQVMFTFDLAEELKGEGVSVNALHPATYMNTTMVKKDGVRPMNSVDEGANAIIQLAVASDMQGKSGQYFEGMHPSQANAQAYDVKSRTRLREISFELIGLSNI